MEVILFRFWFVNIHYNDVIMGAMASQITSLAIVYLFNRLFRHRSTKTSKIRVTGLCAGNSPVTDEFPAQRASSAENVSIWWRHHVLRHYTCHFGPVHQNILQICIGVFSKASSHRRHHDDVIKWKHFPGYWPFVRGIHRSPVVFLPKASDVEPLMFSLICAWTNGWTNNETPVIWDAIALTMTSL